VSELISFVKKKNIKREDGFMVLERRFERIG